MGYPSSCRRDSIGVIIGVKASATVQVTIGGSLDNYIFVDKTDGKGGGLAFYCYFWDALLRIRRTQTSYNCFVYPNCLMQELEGSMDHTWK